MKSHGGYQSLKSYHTAIIVYDFTVAFCERYVSRYSRTTDQMVQAARSGKQNIVEGSQASATSKKTEIKLVGVARASLEELKEDCLDYLRQHNLPLWPKNHPKALTIRQLAYRSNRSYETYKSYLQTPEDATNCLLCLIHQTNYLLDKQLEALEQEFLINGGYTENLFKKRLAARKA